MSLFTLLLFSITSLMGPTVTNLECTICSFRFYLPIGYNGRASSIVVSGTDVIRPRCASQNTCIKASTVISSLKPVFVLSVALLFNYFSVF
jgi:hypothetical protein